AKGLGALWKWWWVGLLLVILWASGVVCQIQQPGSAALLALAVTVHAVFFASLGLWLALVYETTTRAALALGFVVLALTLGPWMLLPPAWTQWAAVVSPPATWWSLCFSWQESSSAAGSNVQLAPALLGVLLYAAAAVACWVAACRCLNR